VRNIEGKKPMSRRTRLNQVTAALGLLVILLSSSSSSFAAAFELPALVDPAGHERHPGKIVWADLVTPDLAGAKRFYGGLFGWTFNDIHTGSTSYSIALSNGQAVAGLVDRAVKPDEHRQPAWLTFISVKDVDQAQRTIVANGGKVLSPARTYAHRGRQAVFADPQGAVFAVLKSSSGDPEDALADSGEWIWSSLVARDPGAAAAFYQIVFDYEVFDLPSDDGLEHVVLATDDYARASANELPADAAKLHPHWLNFVRVQSTTEAASKAESLGGHILVAPHPDRHGGLVAVVSDPAGAPFGLLEWTETDSKQVRP
jgi:uncharacterized protein